MKTIHKYILGELDRQEIEMPEGAVVLKVAEQNGSICVWALGDTRDNMVTHVFYVYGTGRQIHGPGSDYLDSVFVGPFVWHVFYGGLAT